MFNPNPQVGSNERNVVLARVFLAHHSHFDAIGHKYLVDNICRAPVGNERISFSWRRAWIHWRNLLSCGQGYDKRPASTETLVGGGKHAGPGKTNSLQAQRRLWGAEKTCWTWYNK
jgi:hypothetical protein